MKYKECILFTLLLFFINTSLVHGQSIIQNLEVQNFSLNYDGSVGSARIDKLELQSKTVEVDAEDFQVDIEKSESHISLIQNLTKIKLATTEGDLLSSLGRIQLSGLNLGLTPSNRMSLSFNSAHLEIGDGSHTIRQLRLLCESGSSRNGDIFSFLTPCTKYGELSLPELKLSKESKSTIENAFSIDQFMELYKSQGYDIGVDGLIPDKLKEIALKVVNNSFKLTAKVKLLFHIKIQGLGKIYFHQPTSELEVKIDKVKLGIIPITNAVLSAVKKAGLKNVRVQGRSIFIQI